MAFVESGPRKVSGFSKFHVGFLKETIIPKEALATWYNLLTFIKKQIVRLKTYNFYSLILYSFI